MSDTNKGLLRYCGVCHKNPAHKTLTVDEGRVIPWCGCDAWKFESGAERGDK